MNIQINSRFTEVPGYIIHFMKEKLMLAYEEENRIDDVSVTFKEVSVFEEVKYICIVHFWICDRPVLITKSRESYFEAVVDVNEELFNKLRSYAAA
jgi:hypothetical protein